MQPPSHLHSRAPTSGGAASDSGSITSNSSRYPITVPDAQPFNMADAALIPSALNSPTRSCVEVSFNAAVFSRNNSFQSNGGGAAAAAAAAAVARGGAAQEQPGSSSAAAAPSDAGEGGAVVTVNNMPAIIGYFGMTFGNGICAFYGPIFSAKGFSAYQIGMLVAVNPLLCMTLLPTLSYLADKYRCETKMVLVSIAVATVSMIGYTAAKPPYLVVAFFLIMTTSRIMMNPLLDQRTLMMFPRNGRSSAWSYVRSYGAYGWGLGCLVAPLIYTWSGSWVVVTGQYIFGQIGLVYCMLVAKPYERIEKVPVRFSEVLHLLATNQRVMLFIFAATMMGTGYSFIDNFLFLFLEELGGSKTLMGFTVVLTVSTEIPLFQMSEKLHQMFTERSMMTIAMSVWAFRVVCYSMLPNAWWVLLIEPLHGVTFSFMWLPSVHLIARAFPPKLSSSATGVLFTFTSGVGPVIGNLIAGTLYTLIGPRKMFLCAATAMTISLIFYLVMDNLLERRGVSVVCDAHDVETATDVAVVAAGDATAQSGGGSGERKAVATEAPPPTSSSRAAKEPTAKMDSEGVCGGRAAGLDVLDQELPL